MTSDTAFAWIERFLAERLGTPVHLERDADISRLSLPGHEGALTFPTTFLSTPLRSLQ